MPVKHDVGHTETGVGGASWVCQSQKLASFTAQLRTLTCCLFLLRWDYLVCKGEVLGFYSSQLLLLFGHDEYVASFSLHADPVLKQTLSSLIFFPLKQMFCVRITLISMQGLWRACDTLPYLLNHVLMQKEWCQLLVVQIEELQVSGPDFSYAGEVQDFRLVVEVTWSIWSICFNEVQLGSRTLTQEILAQELFFP